MAQLLYFVSMHGRLGDLHDDVTKMMKDGWKPHGNLIVDHNEYTIINGETFDVVYCQPMILI